MKLTGTNTAMMVAEVATTASPIWSAASSAAWKPLLPMRMWRTMFSISTMASSTSTPATSDRASRLIEFSVKPIHCMNANVGIADSGMASAGQGDLAGAEGGGGARAAEHADRLLAAAELRAAAGGIEVQRAQLLVDLGGGDAERLHARRVELDADLAVDPAAALHLRDAGHLQQPLGDGVVDEPGQLLLRERARADRVEDHRAAVGIDALDRGFLDTLGQQHPHLGDRIAHVRDRAVDRGADLELDEDV